MIEKCISFRASMRTCIVVSLLIEMSHEAACLVLREQDSFTLNNYSSNQNLNDNAYMYYGQNTTFIPVVEDNDPNYPYEQLLQLVKDTKRILSSTNITEKMQLNLDPGIYDDYLKGDLSDINFTFRNIDGPPTDGIPTADVSVVYGPPAAARPYINPCLEDVQYQIPRRLTGIDDEDYFIINVGNDLRQKCNSVICKNPKHRCGSIYAVQDYSFTCEQRFDRIRNFVSIPVGSQISVDQQRIQSFKVPDGCFCKGSRNLA